MACCVLAAFIITHIFLFFRKGLNVLLLPLGVQLGSDGASCGVQWSAYGVSESFEEGLGTTQPPLRDMQRMTKRTAWTGQWMRFVKKLSLPLPSPAYGWVALAFIAIELSVVGGLGAHLYRHGLSVATIF